MLRKDFELFRISKKLFVFVIDSPVYSPPGSRDSPVYSPPGSRPKFVFKKNLLVQNTPGSQDSPGINTLRSLDSLVYLFPWYSCKPVLMLVPNTPRSRLPGVFITVESRFPSVFTTGELRLPGVFTTGESILPDVFITGESFRTPGSLFTDFKDQTAIFKGIIILKINCRLL